MTRKALRSLDSPVGRLVLVAEDSGLTHLQFEKTARLPEPASLPAETRASRRHLDAAARALDAYFRGARKDFDELELAPRGTEFQLRVWRALQRIPYGATESYGGLARRIRSPQASRAVGMANNRNPIAIVIPCHRVIGADGTLVGYGGGLPHKQWLLVHEGAIEPELFDTGSAQRAR